MTYPRCRRRHLTPQSVYVYPSVIPAIRSYSFRYQVKMCTQKGWLHAGRAEKNYINSGLRREYSGEELPDTFQCIMSHESGLPFRFLSVPLELPSLWSPDIPLKPVVVCFIGMFSILTVPGNGCNLGMTRICNFALCSVPHATIRAYFGLADKRNIGQINHWLCKCWGLSTGSLFAYIVSISWLSFGEVHASVVATCTCVGSIQAGLLQSFIGRHDVEDYLVPSRSYCIH
jgi:hypothetical protein